MELEMYTVEEVFEMFNCFYEDEEDLIKSKDFKIEKYDGEKYVSEESVEEMSQAYIEHYSKEFKREFASLKELTDYIASMPE
jgi:hypothetical protein